MSVQLFKTIKSSLPECNKLPEIVKEIINSKVRLFAVQILIKHWNFFIIISIISSFKWRNILTNQ